MMSAQFASRFACESIIPRRRDVEPEVYCSTATESECVAGGRTSAPSFKMSVASTRGERTGHYLMQAIVVGREGGHRRHTRIEAPEEAGDIVDTGCVEQQRGLRSPPGCLENAGRDRTGAPVQFRIADLLSACVVERGPKGREIRYLGGLVVQHVRETRRPSP
jgi:hypothetical protein